MFYKNVTEFISHRNGSILLGSSASEFEVFGSSTSSDKIISEKCPRLADVFWKGACGLQCFTSSK
jgi:hypothetical protein